MSDGPARWALGKQRAGCGAPNVEAVELCRWPRPGRLAAAMLHPPAPETRNPPSARRVRPSKRRKGGRSGDGSRKRLQRWTSSEHALLERLMRLHGTEKNWSLISESMPGRTGGARSRSQLGRLIWRDVQSGLGAPQARTYANTHPQAVADPLPLQASNAASAGSTTASLGPARATGSWARSTCWRCSTAGEGPPLAAAPHLSTGAGGWGRLPE
jgi:hypothetical protein